MVPSISKVGDVLPERSTPVIIVFVRGIRGSALKHRGPGPLGNIVEEYVWSEDLSDLLSESKLVRLAFPTSNQQTKESNCINIVSGKNSSPWSCFGLTYEPSE